jgi:two-component system cell cycle sensor histidine kinase/response regulator CckA
VNKPATILVVDDVVSNRDTLRELLESDDYLLVEAEDGPTALQRAEEVSPDLVLLDIMMPGMNGYEVCRRLRASKRLAEVPVIMVTALDDQASRITGIEAGADDFITKPFNRAELRARARTVTRLNRYKRLLDSQVALRSSEERFRVLFELGPVAIYSCDASGTILEFNQRAAELWMCKPSEREVNERYCGSFKLHYPDGTPMAHEDCPMAQVVTGKIPGAKDREIVIERPDGSMITAVVNIVTLKDDHGKIMGAINCFHDITESKLAQEQILRVQRLDNLGSLAAGIAHDFNNALAPIIMAGPLIKQQLSVSDGQRRASDGTNSSPIPQRQINPGVERLLAVVEKCAERGAGLVRQLLTFARGASGERQLLQARHVLREVGDLVEATFPKSINIRIVLPGDLWPILANATQIHQVLLNLCVNARDAMADGGELTLTARNRTLDAAAAAEISDARPGQFIEVKVQDTGAGIPAEVLARIWEPFFTTKGVGNGTGLGLSTVRGILQQHEGFITVDTGAGRGTTFSAYLPTASEELGRLAAPVPAKAERGKNELILVVDDDDSVLLMTARVLGGHGYRTVTAVDGADAIAVFAPRSNEVKLLLTDLQMPILGGLALVTALRRLQPGLAVIEMSGAANNKGSVARNGLSNAFLAKPFQAETLLAVVRDTLDSIAYSEASLS